MVDATKVCSIEVNTGHAGTKKYPLFIGTEVNKEGKRPEGDCAILLGKNGSGKSTIARALSTETEGTLFLDGDNKSVNGDLSNVYVFDENFISKNFRRLDGDHLNPIILLGESVQFQEEINSLEEDRSRIQGKINNIDEEIKGLENKKKESFKEIKKKLSDREQDNKQDFGSWKARTRYYNRGNQYKNLSTAYIEELIYQEAGSESLSTILSEFQSNIKKLEEATNFQKIDWSPEPIILPFDINKIKQAIRDVHQTEELNIDNNYYVRIRDSKINISDLEKRVESTFADDTLFCPHCFQNIQDSYKKTIIDAINKYVDNIQKNDSIQKLKSLKFEWRPQKQSLPDIDISQDIRDILDDAWNELDDLCSTINYRIQEKINDPEKEISLDDLCPEVILRNIKNNHQTVQKLVDKYNSQGKKVEDIRSESEALNEKLSVLEISTDAVIYKDTKNKIDSKKKDLDSEKDEIHSIEKNLNEKYLRLKNQEEASERINELLSVVFGNNGISLEPDVDLGYRVVNNNKDVPPNRLSTGEQNILSLCYFFVNIANDKKFEESYGSNQLVVLDDPISSFDYDNKYGAIALLGYIARSMFQKGSKTKLLIMTHDPSVASDISKFMKDICSGGVLCWKFQNDDLKQVNFDYVDEYKRILSCMCDFALEETSVEKIPTANEVRRVWEAFLRFELGEKNLSDASTSKMIRTYFNEIGEPESKFLNIFPSRTFINPDSHSGSQMLYFNFDLTPTLGSRDLKRFVREIICFMQIVSPYHIASRLEGSSESIEARRKKLNELRKDVIENL